MTVRLSITASLIDLILMPDKNLYSPTEEKVAKPATSKSSYWLKSLLITLSLLAIWAFLSLGCGVVLRGFLDRFLPSLGGAPFGFWMAQQGAIAGFLVLLVIYMILMNRLDDEHGYGDEEQRGAS
ncbi:MAG: DUF4212 domain-containing protein [Planctomycetota bacterium]|nr:DUF4212 domain-containing protein [Planctomycetota bacterium]